MADALTDFIQAIGAILGPVILAVIVAFEAGGILEPAHQAARG